MTERLRIAVYDQYWSTFGGGEQVAGAIAHALAADHDVTMLTPGTLDAAVARERLGVDVSACAHEAVVDEVEAEEASAGYDLFVNCTYRSRIVNRAERGWYYVHFPQPPPTRRDVARHWFGVAGVKALSVPPRLPGRLLEVRAGFGRRVDDLAFVRSYQRYLANSHFTAEWVDRLWDVASEVIYPPVRTTVAPGVKGPTILNLGRFFDPRSGHSKKQLELVRAFGELADLGLDDWTLALAGGCDGPNRDYYLAVRRAALGRTIEVHVNATGEVVGRLLAEASIYWHASGFGEDPARHPERHEHFGIAVVEAMAAGAVPLVLAAGGPMEVVEDGRNGYHWSTLDELVELTRRLIDDPDHRRRLATAAVQRAADFSVERFEREVAALLG